MIKLVVFDFDGVFTDGKIIIDSKCEVIKSYNVKDGTGIKSLYQNNINVIVISGYKHNKSQSNILKHLGVKFLGVNVLENQTLREKIKIFSDWPTIPQLYIKGEFIGGCDIVKDMFEKGELKKILEEKKLI